jgi:hypothetical protein
MPKLDETWDWGISAGTGQHRAVPRRRRVRFRLRLPVFPARRPRDSGPRLDEPILDSEPPLVSGPLPVGGHLLDSEPTGDKPAGRLTPAGHGGAVPAANRPPALVRLVRRHAPYVVLVGGLACLAFVMVEVLAPAVRLGSGSADRPGATASVDAAMGQPTAPVSGSASPLAPPSSAPPPPLPTPSNPALPAKAVTPRGSTTQPRATPPTPAPTRTTPRPPTFTPVSIQAEAAANALTGGAKIVACPPCDGGGRVGYIAGTAQLVMNTGFNVAGSRTLTVTYESDGLRLIKISANGKEIAQRWVTGTGWEAPQTFAFAATLPAGALQIAFYNDVGPAPDIDKVAIS